MLSYSHENSNKVILATSKATRIKIFIKLFSLFFFSVFGEVL